MCYCSQTMQIPAGKVAALVSLIVEIWHEITVEI